MPPIRDVLHAGSTVGNLYVISLILLEHVHDLGIISSVFKQKQKWIKKVLSEIHMSTELPSMGVKI